MEKECITRCPDRGFAARNGGIDRDPIFCTLPLFPGGNPGTLQSVGEDGLEVPTMKRIVVSTVLFTCLLIPARAPAQDLAAIVLANAEVPNPGNPEPDWETPNQVVFSECTRKPRGVPERGGIGG